MAKGHGGGGVLAEDGGQNAYRGRERESTGLDSSVVVGEGLLVPLGFGVGRSGAGMWGHLTTSQQQPLLDRTWSLKNWML